MITLYQLPPAFDLPVSVSPFCAKLEVYFRLAGIAYETKEADYRKAPRGKVPYIDADGQLMGDSHCIIAWAKATLGDPLDGELTEAQHRHGHLLRRMVEDHLYWSLLWSRFGDPEGWKVQRPVVAGLVPALLRPVLVGVIRRGTLKGLHGHGLGRHDQEYIYEAGSADVDVLAAELRDRPFLLGDRPTSYDCSAFAVLLHIATTRSKNALTDHALGIPAIPTYVDRMRAAADLA
ncbi:MAG: glutathione S-transferase family protein [Sandaracinaceae bacterium]